MDGELSGKFLDENKPLLIVTEESSNLNPAFLFLIDKVFSKIMETITPLTTPNFDR